MSATTITAGVSAAHATRRALFALAAVVLLVTAFAIGRVTVNTTHRVSTIAPVSVPKLTTDVDNTHCYTGRPC